MDIVKIDINKLEQNIGQIEGLPANPRQWGKRELQNLQKSLLETPELFEARGIIVYPYEGKYVVLGGNMRLAASKENGAKEVPCIVFPEETPVRKLKEIVIKDNGCFGEWDVEMLAKDWGELPLIDWGLQDWEQPINANSYEETAEDDFDIDQKIPPVCQEGDIWALGKHRLVCGDARNAAVVEKLMQGELADLWLTDPPYNVDYEGGTEDALKIRNDNMSETSFREFLKESFATANGCLKPGAAFYIWHSDSNGYSFRSACNDVGWKVRECLIWNKNALVVGRQDYQWKHEPCLYGWKDGAPHKWYSDRKQTTVLDFDRPAKSEEHPTMKPIKLFAYQICNSTKEGDVILDSFGGSGTTIIAAEQLGRKARVIELDPHYCDVIITRWEKLTGKKAVKTNKRAVK